MRLAIIRIVLIAGLVLPAGGVAAQSTDQHLDRAKGSGTISGLPSSSSRIVGDTVEDPFILSEIPAYETGNTCEFNLDYDEICPRGANARDVVYEYYCPYQQHVHIDLCESLYDTKVYVYDFEAGYGVGNPLACNDDSDCGPYLYRSELFLDFEAGHTYHIVVDGYGNQCGEYILQIDEARLPR